MRVNKFLYEIIVQGCYCGKWWDECAEETHSEARKRVKEYQENCPYTSFRIIRRRTPNPEYQN